MPLRQRLFWNIDWLGNLFFIGSISSFTLAITFGGSVFLWNSASEIVLWIMTGVLFFIFGLTQAFHPLVDVQHKLYPTIFLQQPTMIMLQLSVFMSSVSLLVSHAISVLNGLRRAVLTTIIAASILYTTVLSVHSSTPLPPAHLQLRALHHLGLHSSRFRSSPSPIRDHGRCIFTHKWVIDGEARLLHAVVPFWWRTCARRLYPLVYVTTYLSKFPNPSAYQARKIPLRQLLHPQLFTDTLS